MECLAQCLHLPQPHRPIQISGFGGTAAQTASCSVVNFKVSRSHHEGKAIVVEAVVVPRVTTEIPSTSVTFDTKMEALNQTSQRRRKMFCIRGAEVYVRVQNNLIFVCC